MARFEAALARACAAVGLLPAQHAEAIARVCEGARFDATQLAREGRAGTLAIPFVRQLTAKVAAVSAEAARHVHEGATSQDVIDTGIVLCLRPACTRIAGLARELGDALESLALRHAHTPILSRTLLQPAVPAPFGWKVAVWLSMIARALPRFSQAASDACVLQFAGPGGTLSAFGEAGLQVEAALATDLALGTSPVCWHSARDGFARLGAETAILGGASAKLARDVSLLMQPELGEVAEPAAPGRGGSSSLPHKRNPALCMLALEAGQRLPGLAATLLAQLSPEHERGLGQWQSQWFTLRELLCATASSLAAMREVAVGLEVHPDSMKGNIDRQRGLVFSEALAVRLGKSIGKSAAHALAERLSRQALASGSTLLEAARSDAEVQRLIPSDELDSIFEPERTFGVGVQMLERAVAQWREARNAR